MFRLTSWVLAALATTVASSAAAQVTGGTGASTASPSPAPTSEPSASALVAARELFREAGQDADAGKFELALEKYRRVAAVKETGQVRYNIARCEEQLGQIASALADYELVERDTRDAHGDAEADLRTTSHDRGAALRPRVPRLTLLAPLPEPPGFVVRLDGAIVADAALGVPLPVDPGRHVVEASAGGRLPLTRELEVREKEVTRVPLELEKSAASSDAGATVAAANGTQRISGWTVLGAGATFGSVSLVFLALHQRAVSGAESDCPDGRCPTHAAYLDASGKQPGASTDEGLSVGFAIAGVLAAGAGLALVLTAKPGAASPVAILPGAAAAPAGATFRASF